MRVVHELWGTAISVDVPDAIGERPVDAVFAWFERVDALFSTWRHDSEIVQLASGALAPDEVSDEVRTVLHRCESLRLATGGAFDVRATSRIAPARRGPGWCGIDPSGMVKGWAIQCAADQLQAAGAARLCINAGGDVVVRGATPWRVGIQHPFAPDEIASVIAVVDAGVATSGRYERGDHIVDPRTGSPAQGLASVTIVSSDLALADAYATAAVALGRDGIDWLGAQDDLVAMVITDDGDVLVTSGFDRLRRRAARMQGCPGSVSASRF